MTKKIAYFLLTIVLIWAWFRLVDVHKVAEELGKVNPLWIGLSASVTVIVSFVSAFRLQILLSGLKKVSYLTVWSWIALGFLAGLVLPTYLGGFGMAYLASKYTRTPYIKAFLVLLTDYAMGQGIVGLLGLVAIGHFYPKMIGGVNFGKGGVLLISVVVAVVIIFLAKFGLERLGRLGGIRKTAENFRGLFKIRVIFKALALSVVIVILGAISVYLNYLAFGLQPPVGDFFLANSLWSALGALPRTPLQVGQYEVLGVLTLPTLLNLDKNAIGGLLVVQHAVLLVIGFGEALAGVYYLRKHDKDHR